MFTSSGYDAIKWGFDVVNYEEFLGVPGTAMLQGLPATQGFISCEKIGNSWWLHKVAGFVEESKSVLDSAKSLKPMSFLVPSASGSRGEMQSPARVLNSF